MLSEDDRLGVTDMLVRINRIDENPPDDDDEKSTREKVVQKYHRHAGQLTDDGVLEKSGSEYLLTNTGRIVAELVNVRREVDQQMALSDF